MPIFKCTLWARRKIVVEVECGKHDDPLEKACSDVLLRDDEQLEEGGEVELSDNQYTDLEELKDREGKWLN